jgi:threonine/homoserine/homoserine lactone efflux protein
VTDFQPLLSVAALDLAAAMSPGPAFVLITHTAASSKRPVAWATAAGTVAGSLIWAAAALLGWQLLLARAASIYRFLQIGGGLYLCFIGWSTWRHAADPLPPLTEDAGHTVHDGFRKGLLLGLSNPKVIVFFGTVFTALFTPSTPAWVRWSALLVILVNETAWYGSLATVFGISVIRRTYARLKVIAERFFGAVLMVFGARLVWNGSRGA